MKVTIKQGWQTPALVFLAAIMAAVINTLGASITGPRVRGLVLAFLGGGTAILAKGPKTRAGGLGVGTVGVLVALSSFMDSTTFLRGPGRRLSSRELEELRKGIKAAAQDVSARTGVPISTTGPAAPRYGYPVRTNGSSRMGVPVSAKGAPGRGW